MTNPQLNNKLLRPIAYTLVISGSFYLGIYFYPLYTESNQDINAISLRNFSENLEKAGQKDLTVKAGSDSVIIKNSELKSWIETYIRNYSGKEDMRLSFSKITKYLETLAPRFDIEPVNARLTYKNSRAEVFVPSIQGRKVNITTSAASIASTLIGNTATASLVFETFEPEITLDKINDLGIETMLGRGESDYGKSSSARIHNIKIGMSKFNGIILKPGEEFSFNTILGEVNEEEGYKAELVIKSGQLVKEFGGGLCQVATTIFRGAIFGGLEIKERKPHSFPVQYYNPQGFDATIYPGIVDLKFSNNTESHILIQTKLIGSRLTVEVYGKKTGQTIKLDGPFQYDQQPSGAMKAYFIRKTSLADGTIKEERFNSVYKAPPPHPEERNPLE